MDELSVKYLRICEWGGRIRPMCQKVSDNPFEENPVSQAFFKNILYNNLPFWLVEYPS